MAINQKWWQSTIRNLGMWQGINGWLETVIPYAEIVKPSNKQTETLAAFKRNSAYQSRFVPETLRTISISDRIAPLGENAVSDEQYPRTDEQQNQIARRMANYADNYPALFGSNPRWRNTQNGIGWRTVLNSWNWWPLLRHSHQPNTEQMYYQGFLANTMAYYTGYYQEWYGGDTYVFGQGGIYNRRKKLIKTLNWKLNNKGEIYPARDTSVQVTGVDRPELKDYGDIAVWPQLMWGDLPRLEGIPFMEVPDTMPIPDEEIGETPRYYNNSAGTSDRVIVARLYTNLHESKQKYRIQFETYQEVFGSTARLGQVDKLLWIVAVAARVATLIKPPYRTEYFQSLTEWINQKYATQLTSRGIKKLISVGADQYDQNWCLAAPTMKSKVSSSPIPWMEEITSEEIDVLANRNDLESAEATVQDWVLETLQMCFFGDSQLTVARPSSDWQRRKIHRTRFKINNELVNLNDLTMQQWQELFWDKMQTGSRPKSVRTNILKKPVGENGNWGGRIELLGNPQFSQNFAVIHQNNIDTEIWIELMLSSELMPLGNNNDSPKKADRLGTQNLITPNQYGGDVWWESFVGESGFLKYGDASLWYSLERLFEAWPRLRALAEEEEGSMPVWLQSTAEEAWEKVYQGQSLQLNVLERPVAPSDIANQNYPGSLLYDGVVFMLPERIKIPNHELVTTENTTNWVGIVSGGADIMNLLTGNTVEELNASYNSIVTSYYRNSDTTFTTMDGTAISNWPLVMANDGRNRVSQRFLNSIRTNHKFYLIDNEDAEWQQIAAENSEKIDSEDNYGGHEFFLFDLPESWNFPVNRNMESRAIPRFGFIINWSKILSYRIKTMLAPDN
jgi:hypothetical protein